MTKSCLELILVSMGASLNVLSIKKRKTGLKARD